MPSKLKSYTFRSRAQRCQQPVADPDLELRGGPGFDLLTLLAFIPSVSFSFFTQNKVGARALATKFSKIARKAARLPVISRAKQNCKTSRSERRWPWGIELKTARMQSDQATRYQQGIIQNCLQSSQAARYQQSKTETASQAGHNITLNSSTLNFPQGNQATRYQQGIIQNRSRELSTNVKTKRFVARHNMNWK